MKNRRIKTISVLCFVMLAIIITNMALYASATPAQQENNMVLDSSKPTEWIPNKDINTKGDLSLEELKTAVLKSEDIPEFITDEHISKNGHAHRLYQQEEDLNTVVFQNRDGSKTAYVFDEQIKYRDKNGNVRDRSTALTREQNGYRMKDNIVTLFMPNDISTGISLGVDNINITMTPYTFDKKAKVTHSINENDEVTYYGVFGSKTSVKYTPLLSGVKEDIILEEYTGTDSFSFLLTTNGYSVIQSFGKCYLSDPLTGEICGSFGDVIIYDASGNTATGCMTLKDIETDNKYILTIHADRSFLASETTQYPVTIDPTFEMTNNLTAANILDATVYSTETSGYHGGSTTLKVGIDSQLGAGRMYFRFPRILNNYAVTNQYYNVTRVELYLYNNSSNTTENTLLIHKHAGEGNWTEVEATCLNIGYHDIGTMLGSTVVSATNQYYSFDITDAFNSWKTNSDEFAKGIMIRAQNLSSAEYAKTFASTESDTNKPYVVFTYTDLTPMVCMYHGNLTLPRQTTYQAQATLWIGENIVPSNGQIEFFSSDTTVATISSSGLITTKKIGTTTITAKYKNDTNYQCQILLTVTESEFIKWGITPEQAIIYNCDEDGMATSRKLNLNAYREINGEALTTENGIIAYDSGIEYTIVDLVSGDSKLYEYASINENTGVITITPKYTYQETYHPVGVLRIQAKSEFAVNTIDVTVLCHDTPLPNATNIYVYGGRYIQIPHSNQSGFGNSGEMEIMLSSRGLSFDHIYEDFASLSDDDKRYRVRFYDDEKQVHYLSFFEVMRYSKYVFVLTHGQSNGFNVSASDPNLLIKSDEQYLYNDSCEETDINLNSLANLHQGYFNYCELIFYANCSSGMSTYDTDTENIIKMTIEKGAKNVIGFKNAALTKNASGFEFVLLKTLGTVAVDGESRYGSPVVTIPAATRSISKAYLLAVEIYGDDSFTKTIIFDHNTN